MTSPRRAVGSKHCGCAPPSLSQAAAVTAHYDGVRFSRCVQFVTSGCKFSTEKRNLQICRNHNFPTSTPLRVQKKSHFSFLISHYQFYRAVSVQRKHTKSASSSESRRRFLYHTLTTSTTWLPARMRSGHSETRGLIFYEAGECGVAHSVEPCAHIVSRAVG